MKTKQLILVVITLPVLWSSIFAGGKRAPGDALIARQVPLAKYKKTDKDMVVTFIDVGQGNSILVEAPSGAILLYDSGGNPEWMKSSWDPGWEIIVPFLESRGIEKLDYGVISHAHGDHISGFRTLIYSFDIDLFLDPGFAYTTMIYKNLLETIKSKKVNYGLIKAGDGNKIDLGPGIVCKVFNPPVDYFFRGTNSDCNNSSVLLKITYGDVSFLFTGDLEKKGELYCAKKYGDELEANILQVAHHGSFTSSNRPFLEKVMPEVAVIPVGEKNMFGHPRPEALSRLESIDAKIYRTDFDGNVTVYTNGKTFIVETED